MRRLLVKQPAGIFIDQDRPLASLLRMPPMKTPVEGLGAEGTAA